MTDRKTPFATAVLDDLEKLQLLRRSVAALATLTGIEATFTHGASTDAMEMALDELPGGSFGVLRFGGDAGVSIDLIAVTTVGSPTASLIVSAPPMRPTEPVGIERLYDLLESLPPHVRPTLDPRAYPSPNVAIAGLRTVVALTLDPDTNAGLIEWAIGTLRDGHQAVADWLLSDGPDEWERDCVR